jgi:signal transduction histidine kinase
MAKLLVVLVATGCLVNFTVGGFYRLLFTHQAHAGLERNVIHYAHLLAAEIGSPPDTAKARSLSEAYSLRIRYLGPGGNWDSHPEREFTGPAGEKPMDRVGWRRGRFFARVPQGAGEFIFVTDFRQMMDNHGLYLILVILILSLVLACAFLAIRRLLSPLKSLSAAVERLGRGELGHQVPVRSHDEFGDLAESFNTMSSRLAALVRAREQLLLDVSHELRSPLTRIKVALELAPEGKDTEGIREDLREMESMIGEILEAARLDSVHGKLNLETFDLKTLVSEVVAEAALRPPGATLTSSATDASVSSGAGTMVVADRARIRKVLANVMENAGKFSQDQGSPIEVRIEAGNSAVTVRIRDRGVGIPAEEIPNLFEPFYRIDRSRSRETGGYGLGLSLCKRIMEAHGGTIDITSSPGEGTEVSLALPRDY